MAAGRSVRGKSAMLDVAAQVVLGQPRKAGRISGAKVSFQPANMDHRVSTSAGKSA